MYGYEAVGWGEYNFAAADALAPYRVRPGIDPGTSFTGDVTKTGSVFSRQTNLGTVYVNAGTFQYGFPGPADTTLPALVGMPADMTVETPGASGVAVNYTPPIATDDQDPAPVVSCAPVSGVVFPLGESTVTCSARDATGNQSSASFKVTVVPATVFVRLLDSAGYGLAGGTAQYYQGGWQTVPGSTAGGKATMELLPNTYTFAMTYANKRAEKTQNVAADPIVVFVVTQ